MAINWTEIFKAVLFMMVGSTLTFLFIGMGSMNDPKIYSQSEVDEMKKKLKEK